jgi:alanine dehydrogenase
VVDVAIDQGGCIETIKPTTHAEPTYMVNGVVHYGVTNMPGAVAQTSTFGLTNATIGYAAKLAALGVREAVQNDAALAKGVNTHDGFVAHDVVARDLGLPFKALNAR